jgi:electron transport complex protein RnfE
MGLSFYRRAPRGNPAGRTVPMSDNYVQILEGRPLAAERRVFAQMLAMCPAMAVTTSGTNGLGMGLATTAVLVA